MVCNRNVSRIIRRACVLRIEACNQMIEQFLSPFDWVLQLPIDTQFHFAAYGSLTGFLFSAIVRESTKDWALRMWARAVGLGAFVAMICYASYATNEVKMLASELMVKRGQNATSIADQSRVVAVASEFSCDVAGTKISFIRFSDGRVGPLSTTGGCTSSISSGNSSGVQRITGSDDFGRTTDSGVDDVSHAKSVDF